MKKLILILLLSWLCISAFSQQNKFYIDLIEKDLATFNDGITLMRLLYNEEDENAIFADNILWAAEKKLFRVSIPIKIEEINPVLTRREFAFWICKIFNTKGGLVNRKKIMKYSAYKICVDLGILAKGRGAFDSFTGQELLDTFSYLDYYIKYKKLKPKEGILEFYDDEYDSLPDWRARLYRELDEQQKQEKEKRLQKKETRKKKRQERIDKQKNKEKEIEKIKEKKIEE